MNAFASLVSSLALVGVCATAASAHRKPDAPPPGSTVQVTQTIVQTPPQPEHAVPERYQVAEQEVLERLRNPPQPVIVQPAVNVTVATPPQPVYVRQSRHYSPPPVAYCPPPVVYTPPPVYYAPPPVVYAPPPPPVVVYPAPAYCPPAYTVYPRPYYRPAPSVSFSFEFGDGHHGHHGYRGHGYRGHGHHGGHGHRGHGRH